MIKVWHKIYFLFEIYVWSNELLDYYEWETHIFFDDAFEPDDDGEGRVVNQERPFPGLKKNIN